MGTLHSLCVGPGLGRHAHVHRGVAEIVAAAVDSGTPVVIDADGLRLVTHDPGIVRGHRNVVLTPNIIEFQRLCAVLRVDVGGAATRGEGEGEGEGGSGGEGATATGSSGALVAAAEAVARELGNVTLVLKGAHDIVTNGLETCVVTEPGGMRRSGGQGDVLAGLLALTCAWARMPPSLPQGTAPLASPQLWASYMACVVTRRASRQAFEAHGRSMATPDILSYIGGVMEDVCPSIPGPRGGGECAAKL